MHVKTVAAAVLAAGGCLVAACRPAPEPPAASLERALQTIVADAVAGHEADFGAALHVDAPRSGLTWEGAAGVADPATGEEMTAALPVLVASNTKTFISVSILKLREQGRLGLDDPIAAHLPGEYVELLRGDGYDPDTITIRHLLTHTSGLFDFADADIYTEEILADPNHRWTRTEQLEAAMEWGDPYGPPGEVYRYCDTGYILLGEILEQVTGRTMPDAVRELGGLRPARSPVDLVRDTRGEARGRAGSGPPVLARESTSPPSIPRRTSTEAAASPRRWEIWRSSSARSSPAASSKTLPRSTPCSQPSKSSAPVPIISGPSSARESTGWG